MHDAIDGELHCPAPVISAVLATVAALQGPSDLRWGADKIDGLIELQEAPT